MPKIEQVNVKGVLYDVGGSIEPATQTKLGGIKPGAGLAMNGETLNVQLASPSGLSIDGTNRLKINIGKGLWLNYSNSTLNASDYNADTFGLEIGEFWNGNTDTEYDPKVSTVTKAVVTTTKLSKDTNSLYKNEVDFAWSVPVLHPEADFQYFDVEYNLQGTFYTTVDISRISDNVGKVTSLLANLRGGYIQELYIYDFFEDTDWGLVSSYILDYRQYRDYENTQSYGCDTDRLEFLYIRYNTKLVEKYHNIQ